MIYYVLEVMRFQIKKHVSMLTNKMQLVKIWEREQLSHSNKLSWALLSLGEIESRKAKLRAVNSNIEIALHSISPKLYKIFKIQNGIAI